MRILNNVLFEASKPTVFYDNFQIVDYIDNDYFKLDSEDDVEVSQGTVKLSEENGKQKIVWNLDGLASGRSGQLTMKLNLKNEYVNQGGNYSTNDETQVVSSMKNDSFTVDEMMLAGASDSGIANVDFYLYPGSVVGTFTMSPSHYNADYPWNYYYMLHSGVLRSIDSNVSFPVRPSISLIPETLVVSGDGSSENPYIVDFPKN